MNKKTKWCVITGAPSSGKTTLINALSIQGYRTVPEVARAYLSYLFSSGHYDPANCSKDQIIQKKICSLKLDREKNLPPDELIFFDRGLPDSLAYYRYYQFDERDIIKKMSAFRYEHVFFLEGLPVIYDEIRRESEHEAHLIGEFIYNAYRDLGYKVIRIPAATVEKRVEQVLSTISAPYTAHEGTI